MRTAAPFAPRAPVKVRISHQDTTFQSISKVVYAIVGEGMGIHFENIQIGERVNLKDWLVQLSDEELRHRIKATRQRPELLKKKRVIVVSTMGLIIVVGILIWLAVQL